MRLLVVFVIASSVYADDIKFVTWNARATGTDSAAAFLESIARARSPDLYFIQELKTESVAKSIVSRIGLLEGAPALEYKLFDRRRGRVRMVAYDSSLIAINRVETLEKLRVNKSDFPPVLVSVEFKKSKKRVTFVVCRFSRRNHRARMVQAVLLRNWVQSQAAPIVICGDFFFGWEPEDGALEHDCAFDELTRGSVLRWLRPDSLRPTRIDGSTGVEQYVFGSDQLELDWWRIDHLSAADVEQPEELPVQNRAQWAKIAVSTAKKKLSDRVNEASERLARLSRLLKESATNKKWDRKDLKAALAATVEASQHLERVLASK